MDWQIESLTLLASPVFSCGLVTVSSKMHSVLTSRIYRNDAQQSASLAAYPSTDWSIPMFRADSPTFASKLLRIWPYLLVMPETWVVNSLKGGQILH
jgi:hypothetical protein